MSAIFVPASGATTLKEFVGTPGLSVTLTPPPAPVGGGGGGEGGGEVVDTITYSYDIVSVTCTDSHIPDDLVITFDGDTFTIVSEFPDMFDRVIKYLVYDEDNVGMEPNYNVKTYLQVTRFKDLPDLFTGVYRYIPPSVQTRPVSFTVVYDENAFGTLSGSATSRVTETWTFIIEENWELALSYLKYYVKQGTKAKQATQRYPELNN